MTKKKRILSLVMAVVFCFAAIFSVCFSAAEAHHDCVGENCAICAVIEACETISACAVLVLVSILFGISASKTLHYICAHTRSAHTFTPVSFKVKLSN